MRPPASRPASPDRRLAPRPLPAHLASAMTLWLSSRAALPILKSVSQVSSAAGEPLRVLAGEIDALGPERVAAALDRALGERAERCLRGLEAYRCHPFRRSNSTLPVVWREGTTRLLDYGSCADPAVLVVPSLINRHYVLDLLPERSFLRQLAANGLRPLVVDWDEPGPDERRFDLTDYIAGRLEAAFDAALGAAGAPLAVIGYCMGGLLALALALRRRREVACLALLATPWDFHAEGEARARLLGAAAAWLPAFYGSAGTVPVDWLQSLFLLLDPFAAERKFVRFAGLDADGMAARSFVALEDWINDGVPLALPTACDCLRLWYGENEPGRGRWRVAGRPVQPQALRRPALVVVPGGDRIVPPRAAEPLAAALGEATVLRPALGHVGMMSAARAPALLWAPVAEWLRRRLPAR
jgi:poly[(R)-3-hydroxyalkanoate] polymerase subunit PhaC